MVRLLVFALVALAGVLAAGAAIVVALLSLRGEGAYVRAGEVDVHYTVEGGGEPVVLLHGFAVNADLNWRWTGIADALAERFTVITPDVRGHGRSGSPHDPALYGMAMVHDVVRLLDHLGIQKARVVGYSLGGFIALKLAAAYPSRVARVCLIGAGWERPDNPGFVSALATLAARLERGEGIGPLSPHFGQERPPPGLLHRWGVWLLTRFFNDHRALAALVRSLPDIALTEAELRGIRVPVCAIVGSRDPLRPSAEALRGRIPDLTYTLVPDAEHIGLATRPETLEALQAFLSDDQLD